MKTILLTGSGGFIGKNLKFYLEKSYELLTPRSFELDLRDANAVDSYFKTHKIDSVIHCASVGGARGIADSNSTVDDNLKMVDNLLNAKDSQTKVILFGSGAMYDKSQPISKMKESELGERIPNDLYGMSKLLIAQKIKDRKDVVCLNIFACYGYGEKETRFPSYAINQVIKGEDITINQNVKFDYLFVEDMCKIVENFLVNIPESNIINITPTESVTLSEIAEIVSEFGEKKVNIKIENQIMNNEYTGDNSILLKNYPIKFTDIKTGLRKLYNYNLNKQEI